MISFLSCHLLGILTLGATAAVGTFYLQFQRIPYAVMIGYVAFIAVAMLVFYVRRAIYGRTSR